MNIDEDLSMVINNCEGISDENKLMILGILKAKQENRLIELITPIGADVWVPQIMYCCCGHSLDYISIRKRKYQISLIGKPAFITYKEAEDWAKERYPEMRIECL